MPFGIGVRMVVCTAALLVLAGCTTPPTPAPSRVEITPGGLLLTPDAPIGALTAAVFDQFGQPMDVAVAWTSSDPSVVTVDADGAVTAQADLGSAQVTARAGAVHGTVIVVLAQPVPGATVVSDAQIVGEPVAVDPSAPFDVGMQYVVTLTGANAPTVGSILLGSGEKPVAGRVVQVDGPDVTLELVPIDEVFAGLDIEESFDLAEARFTTPDAVAQAFEIRQAEDGAVTMHLRDGHTLSSPGALDPQAEFGAGAFRCETQLSAVQIQLLKSDLTFNPGLSFDIVWNDTQRKIVVNGSPRVSLEVTPVVSVAIDGKVTCKLTFREIHVPVPGPLGLFIGAVVPIGAGFEIGGKLPVGQIGMQFKSEVGANVQMGFDCNPNCVPVQSLTPILDGNAKPVLPATLTGVKVEASAYAFLFADLEGGARFSSTLRVEAIESAAGLKFDAKLATEETQADDAGYASEYELSFEASVAAGSGFQRFLNLVRVTVARLELKLVQSIARSPASITVTADQEAFSTGETVTFTVALNPATIAFPIVGYNVAAVRIYRKDAGSLVLANEVVASTGQTDIEIPWVATVDGTVTGNFVAFVMTNLFSSPRLELGAITATEPGFATYSFTEETVMHRQEVNGDSTVTEDETETFSVFMQLRVLSSSPQITEFEVVGGTLSVSGTYDYVEENLGAGFGECTYDERIEDHASTNGTGTATGSVVLGLDGVDSYEVGSSALVLDVETNGVWTARYQFLGSETDCRVDVTDPYHQSWTEDRFAEVDGTTDPSQPGLYQGSAVQSFGDTTITTTWSLQMQ